MAKTHIFSKEVFTVSCPPSTIIEVDTLVDVYNIILSSTANYIRNEEEQAAFEALGSKLDEALDEDGTYRSIAYDAQQLLYRTLRSRR